MSFGINCLLLSLTLCLQTPIVYDLTNTRTAYRRFHTTVFLSVRNSGERKRNGGLPLVCCVRANVRQLENKNFFIIKNTTARLLVRACVDAIRQSVGDG